MIRCSNSRRLLYTLVITRKGYEYNRNASRLYLHGRSEAHGSRLLCFVTICSDVCECNSVVELLAQAIPDQYHRESFRTRSYSLTNVDVAEPCT